MRKAASFPCFDMSGMEKLESERERYAAMTKYENKHYSEGLGLIAGIDEAGRGPLCGPVTAACVILRKGEFIPYLNDSKKVAEKRRESLYAEITAKAVAWGVFFVSSVKIDEINILEATKLAMSGAYNVLAVKPEIVLVDALTVPGISCRQEAIVGGDAKSVSIAAASIIAKVARDRLMRKYAELYHGYSLEKNKGYGTSEHMRALRELGMSQIHRASFCSFLNRQENK